MHPTKTLSAAVLAFALAACGGARDPFLAAIPDSAGLALEVQPAPSAGALTSAGDDLQLVREKVDALNGAIERVFARVEELAGAGGNALPGGVKVYGPSDRCVEPAAQGACVDGGTANLRLTIQRVTDVRARYVLEARPAGATAPDAFKPVLAGWLARGEQDRRGAGQLAVNLENLRAAAPGFRGAGYLLAGFWSGAVAKAATYRMAGFTPDATASAPVTAAFHGFKTPAGVTRVRVAGIGDYDPTTPDVELGFWRLAYHPVVGGRAYTVITDFVDASGVAHGDVPPSATGAPQYWFGRACYQPGATTPAYKEWFLCPRAVGPAACVLAAGGQGTQVIGATGATWQTACAVATEPPELALPSGTPAAVPDDTTPEECTAAGMGTQEAVPASEAAVLTAP